MGVLDGQSVNAATTNPAFINKNISDQMPNQLDFTSSASGFGSNVINIQKTVNAIFSFVGASLSSAYNSLPSWVTNNFGTSTDTIFSRVSSIDSAFSPSNGTLAFRAGNVNLANAVTSATATFSTAFSDTNYFVSCAFVNKTDANPIFLQAVITTVSATGFIATFNAPTDTANYSLNYQASRAR